MNFILNKGGGECRIRETGLKKVLNKGSFIASRSENRAKHDGVTYRKTQGTYQL